MHTTLPIQTFIMVMYFGLIYTPQTVRSLMLSAVNRYGRTPDTRQLSSDQLNALHIKVQLDSDKVNFGLIAEAVLINAALI